ncbi:MAG: hypothetical protein KF716_11250 [Anaerolineae bacterium]|nr:hypothetical protein [Anaerolineae bacterium]
MTLERWLAFDIGTTGTKAALIDGDGHTLRSAYRDYPTHTAESGVVEQEAALWWRAVIEAVRELDPGAVDSIVITGQMQDVILIDANGDPVRPVILYSDSRARQQSDEVNTALGSDHLRALTGNSQDAGSLLAKLRWMQQYEAANLRRTAHLLFSAAGFIGHQMTGNAVNDTTTASTTGLMDIQQRRVVGDDMLTTLDLGVVAGKVAPIHAGGTRIGGLSESAAALIGLKAGIPVYHAPGDAGAATLGAGSGVEGRVYAYLGTSGWVAFSSAERLSPDSGVFTLAHPDPGKFIYIAPLLTAGGNLDWARGVLGAESHATMIEAALDRAPTSLLYLPYLNGERSPFSDPAARGAFIGLNPRHTRDDLSRAVLEGVVYAYRHCLDALIKEPVAALTLTGGGTRSPRWCQLFADMTQTTVHIADDASNVGLRGALLAAKVANGQLDSYAPAGFFPISASMQPNTAQQAHYDGQYALFRQTYPALKGIFAGMA